MNTPEAKLLNEVKRLEKEAAETFRRAQSSANSLSGDELAATSAWVTQLGELLRRLYGDKSQQVASFNSAIATPAFYKLHKTWNTHIAILQGIAKGAVHDLEAGLLQDVKALLQAEVFSDFLEMGEHLLHEGYKDAAAVIIGAVLEDTLRKIASRLSIPSIAPNGKNLTIDPLNIEIANARAYSKLVQKQVTTWAHLRNKAAHGQYTEYGKEQVEMMLVFVQSFSSEHLR